MAVGPSPTVRRRRLGIELRRLREAAGLTCEQVGERLDYSGTRISRIETGRLGVRPNGVRELLDVYGVADEATREALIALARDARKKGWWQSYRDVLPPWFESYVGLEAEANTLRIYATQFVPGLLQTKEYARDVLQAGQPEASAEDIDRQADLRVDRRQQVLTKDDPSHLWVVLSEAALRIQVSTVEVMRDQLRHLSDVARLSNVALQVLPFTANAYARAMGPFTILSFPEPADPDVVYLEHLTGSLFLEDNQEVSAYTLAFDHLRAEALGTGQSVELITQVAQGK